MKQFLKKKLTIVMMSLMVMSGIVNLNQVTAQASTSSRTKISSTRLTLAKGVKYKLRMKNARGKVKWSSTNKRIATVSSSGTVKAKNTGKVTIKAKVKGKTYRCRLTVVKTPKMRKPKVTLTVGKSTTLKIKNAKGKIKWSSTHKSVATVNSKER